MQQQQFRKGDIVMVPGVVKYDQSKPDTVYVEVQYSGCTFAPKEIELTRPFFKVGDEAYRPAGIDGQSLERVTVLAVNEDMVWIKDEHDAFASVKAIHLSREQVAFPADTMEQPALPPQPPATEI